MEFINDLSITCSICSTQVFDWYLCRIQCNKICFFFKKPLIPLCSLCKLYNETDFRLFKEYKRKKPESTIAILKVPRETSFGCFSKNTLTQSSKRLAVAATFHKNLTLTILFASKESLPAGIFLKHTWNTHLKHLPNTGNLKQTSAQPAPLNLLREHKLKQYFQDTVNPLCCRSLEAESTSQFFLRCQNFANLLNVSWNNSLKSILVFWHYMRKSSMKLFRRQIW